VANKHFYLLQQSFPLVWRPARLKFFIDEVPFFSILYTFNNFPENGFSILKFYKKYLTSLMENLPGALQTEQEVQEMQTECVSVNAKTGAIGF
jgi:hypothetical protein